MEVLYLLLGAFSNLPPWMRWVFILISIGSVFGLSMFLTPMIGLIVAGGILLIVLLIGLFQVMLKKRREKRAASFGGSMSENAGATPAEINDPARKARLEDLKRNFDQGVQKFKAAGKNLYELPWYVIVGEPGAGKTEAIRRSGVGFPPGMQDEFQGVGGTINMNWWFTNEAVILDTAGRLIFEEVPTGATSEWREFLAMLKAHRPDCPVNGLLLVIPVDSLIKDSGEEIVRKAGKIATQLEVIQKQLDIRFPVYVVISKCDLLNGFREFFDDLGDVAAQQQMTGWSNPDPLDQPFRPELVDEHIQTVARRLTRRRMGLILDPVARSGGRRADEVDRFFALPHSVSMIGPNLQRYLQTLFLPGQWTSQPLFLRGIYFTSSMREGSALDQELAHALSIAVDELPDWRAWERERSYFLKDIFTAKAFLEKGLVTRATNTRQLVNRRRLILFGSGVAALLCLLAFSIFGFSSLRRSIGDQSGYWARAAEGWNGNVWNPVVRPKGPLEYEYVAQQPVGPGVAGLTKRLFRKGDESLLNFQSQLKDLSETPIQVPWWFRIFSGFGVNIDADRLKAQRIVFQDSAVAPVIGATRERMSGLPAEAKLPDPEARAEANALVSLIRLEMGLIQRKEKLQITPVTGETVLKPLLEYTAKTPGDNPLLALMDWVDTVGDAKGNWPSNWVTAGNSLAINTPIDRGLQRFLSSARAALSSESTVYPLLLELTESVRAFGKAEDALYAATRLNIEPGKVDSMVFGASLKLREQRQTLELKLAEARRVDLFGGGPESLASAYERMLESGRFKLQIALEIAREVDSILSATGNKPEYTLAREIQQKLKPVLDELQAKFSNGVQQLNVAELRGLDQQYMLDGGSGKPFYAARAAIYESCAAVFPAQNYSGTLDLIGAAWKPLAEITEKAGNVRSQASAYTGPASDKLKIISDFCLDRQLDIQNREFVKNYLAQSKKLCLEKLGTPLIYFYSFQSLSEPQTLAAVDLVRRILNDLSKENIAVVLQAYQPQLVELRNRISTLEPICKALYDENRRLRMVQIVLLPRKEQFELSGQRVGIQDFPGIQVRAGPVQHGAVVKYGRPNQAATDSPSEVELGRFTLYEPFHFHFHKVLNDPTIAVDKDAPGDWTAIKLLWERRATRLPDGKRWRVGLAPVEGKLVWLELRFEEPLPPLEEWPTRESLGFELKH